MRPSSSARIPFRASVSDSVSSFALFQSFCKNRDRTEVIDRPIRKHSLPVNKFSRYRPENTRVIRARAMVAHDKILTLRNLRGRIGPEIFRLRRNIRLRQEFAVQINLPLANFDRIIRQTDDALDERFRAVQRIPENNHIAALNWLKPVDELIDKNSLLVGNLRGHAGAFDLHRLVEENDDNNGEAEGNNEIAAPTSNFAPQRWRRSGRDSRTDFGVRLHVLTGERLNLYHAPASRASLTETSPGMIFSLRRSRNIRSGRFEVDVKGKSGISSSHKFKRRFTCVGCAEL